MRHLNSISGGVCSLLLMALICSVLNGCTGSSVKGGFAPDAPTLPTGVSGTSDKTIMALQKKLMDEDVRIIRVGELNLVSVPARLLFAEQSPRILWPSYAVLNDVALYLHAFRKVSVQVNAFNCPYQSRARQSALGRVRAKVVADYLWSQDIDSRFVFTQSRDDDKSMTSCLTRSDGSPNARIEITFKQVVA